MGWKVSTLLGLAWLAYIDAQSCQSAEMSNTAAIGTGTVDPAGTDLATCKAQCIADPTCEAYDFTASPASCELHTGKTAFGTQTEAGTTHGELHSCRYWNYVGHTIGCGSAYMADTDGIGTGKTLTASNRWSCWYQCLTFPRCAYWTWKSTTTTCRIFSLESAGSGEASTGVEMYKVICPLEPFNSLVQGDQYWPMHRVNGGEKITTGTFSMFQCQTHCHNTNGCRAVDWDVDKKTCWVHKVKANGKDTSCVNFPKWTPNVYHIKRQGCATYPISLLIIGA